MNREPMGLASASTSSAVPAAKHRGPAASLIAAFIVAAALLFAMPSLAYASDEAEASSSSGPSQEILLSKPDSSTSVNKAPDTPPAPPAYKQQDAYTSTPVSGVEPVSGAAASSYTAGDNKSSINDKDSDDDSDASANGTENDDDSTANGGLVNVDIDTDDDSTIDSNGAISGSTDENATGAGQSAVPTGSNSKADDVIATPCDGESADLNAGTTSDKTEEVYGPYLPGSEIQYVNSSVTTATSNISTADITTAAGAITVHFNYGWTAKPSTGSTNPATSNTVIIDEIKKPYDPVTAPKGYITLGDSEDPIFGRTGEFVTTAGDYELSDASGAAALYLDPVNASTSYFYRYGWKLAQWIFIYKNTLTGYYTIDGQSTFANFLNSTNYKNNRATDIHAYPMVGKEDATVTFISDLTKEAIEGYGGTNSYTTVYTFPEHTGDNDQWIARSQNDPNKKASQPATKGSSIGDLVNSVFDFRSSRVYTSALWGNIVLNESEGSTSFKINFEVGSSDTGKVTVTTSDTGAPIKVNSNGTTKPTADQITAAGVSAKDADKQDGWVFDLFEDTDKTKHIKWNWSMGDKTGTLNKLSDLKDIIITANMTLSPVMKQNTYSVVLDGGKAADQTGFTNGVVSTNPATDPLTINYTTKVALSSPTWTGRTFVGWYTTEQSAVGATPGTNDKKIDTDTVYKTINTTINSTANEDTTSVTLYAWWNALTVPIKFDGNKNPNGGTVGSLPANTSVNYGDSYTLTTTKPTSNGFDFAGWATSASGAVAYAAGATIPATALTDTTDGITLYAKWTEKTGYKVVFNNTNPTSSTTTAYNTQGGTSNSLNWTANVTLPTTPTVPTGYTFDGWYSTMGTNGTTVSGSKMTGTMTYKALLALVNSSATDTTKTINLYAKYVEKGRYTVTLNLNGAGATYNASNNNYVAPNVLHGTDWTIPTTITDPSRDGYNFGGWAETAGGGGTIRNAGATLNITENKTLYAKWTAAVVTVTYKQSSTGNLSGVNNVKPNASDYTTTVNYAANLTVPAGSTMFTRSGYSFKNWGYLNGSNTNATMSNSGGSLTINTTNIKLTPTGSSAAGTLAYTAELYPIWEAYSYTIKWDTQGGNTIENTANRQGNDLVVLPATPSRSGYVFQRWVTAVTNPTGYATGTKEGAGATVVDGSKTLANTWTLPASSATVTAYAIWKEKTVAIRFLDDGSNAGVKWNDGTSISGTLQVGEDSGVIYGDDGNPVLSGTTPRNINNGVLPEIKDSHYEWKVYTDSNFTSKWTVGSKSGSAVNTGWLTTTTGKLVVGKTAQNNKLYADGDYWLTVSPKKYNYSIEYYNEGLDGNYAKVDTPKGSGTQFYGHTVQAGATDSTSGTTKTVAAATQTGFTWNQTHPSKVNSVTISDTSTGNVLKLYYDRNTYTLAVSYTGDRPAGTTYSPATQTVKYGQSVTLTNPTVTPGYTFSGWTASGITFSGTASPKNQFTMPANNLTVTGTWNLQTVNVSFKVGSHGTLNTTSASASQDKQFGSSMSSIPSVTADSGYYFAGWVLYKDCTTKGNETTGTRDRVYSSEEILGTGAYAGNAWKVPAGNSTFVAQLLPTLTISYVAGTGGAFPTLTPAMTPTDSSSVHTITTGGTYYANLISSDALPQFCRNTAGARNSSGFDTTGTRNLNQPKAAAGYKFVGWEWTDALNNTKYYVLGSYNASGVFSKNTSGYYDGENRVTDNNVNMPATVDKSYTFYGLWEKTYQQLHFENTDANGTGVEGAPAPTDVCVQMGVEVNIPKIGDYVPSNKPSSAYKFKGWTTDSTYKSTSPLYTDKFTMTAGTYGASYTMPQAAADGNYGVTLYPVFTEESVTINYALASNMTGTMGSLSKSTETIKMDSGTPAGSTASAKTGYKFVGWYSDAAHTNQISTAAAFTPTKNAGGTWDATTYYAYFEPEEYAITFKIGDEGTWTTPAGDTTDKTMNLTYNTTYGSNIPGTKANTGYGFKHWVDQAGKTYSTSVLSATKITGPMTFTAVWEARSGYTLTFETNGGTPSLPSKQVTWTASIAGSMDASSSNIKKQGYSFAGWYAKSDFDAASLISTALNCAGATDTFATGLGKSGQTAEGDTATLTLYAKWNANEYTISYEPHWPKDNPTTYPSRTATWTDTNLLPAGATTLSMDGFSFGGWNTKADGSGTTITNQMALSDIFVAVYNATDYAVKPITLHAVWGTKRYTVEFQSATGSVLKTETNKKWDDTIDYYAYTVTDGSKTLRGWKYTPQGGTQQTWTSTDATKLVSVLGGDPGTPRIVLTADLQDNTKYIINFNKVGVNADGTPNMGTAAAVGNKVEGWTTPGAAIDITNLNSHDYITEFEKQNGTDRRPDLKGYELKVIPASKTTANADEVASGATITFNVYFVEKMFTIAYDLGVDPQGNTAPSTLTVPASKQAGWNSSDIIPDTTGLTWEGHKAPKWQYKNASGNWVNVPAGATVSQIATSDDNTKTITLRGFWETDKVVITYAASTGGSAKNASGTFTVAGGSQKTETIDALTGTPQTMTATAASGYKFDGWYKDSVLLTTNTTMTPAKEGGMFSSSTYEARFVPLGAIQYTIEHHFEGLDGVYTQNTALNDIRSGEEFSTITVKNDMIKNVKGFTYKPGITGSKETITSLVDGEVLKLFYQRNIHDVYVTAAQGDAPTPVPAVSYPATGITQAHTQHQFDTALVLPSITAPAGWDFKWTVSYKDSDAATTTTSTLTNGAALTMPDANVDIIGTWVRLAHTVTFSAGTDAHGTVTATNGKTLPFSVDHGKKLTDASATGNANDVRVVANDLWAFAGWSYVDAAGVTKTTMNPNNIVIDTDTVFTALWAQTFFVAYNPGLHGGAGFTEQIKAGDDISGAPSVRNYPLMIAGDNKTTDAPAADGYRFVGWSWSLAGEDHYWLKVTDYAGAGALAGTAATMDFNVTNNVIFNAIWEALPQDLVYKLDNKVPASAWTVTGRPGMAGAGNEYSVDPKPRTDEVVNLLTSADVQREGYEFAGWAIWNDANGDGIVTDNELTGKYNGTYKMPARDVTFVPVWDFASIVVRFEFADGAAGRGTLSTTVENIIDGFKTRLDGSVATAKPGYAFEGWYYDAAHNNKVPNNWLDYDFDDDGNIVSTAIKPMRPTDGWVPAVYYANFIPALAEYTIDHYFQQADGSYVKLTTGKFHDVMSEETADVTDPTNPAFAHKLSTESGQYKGYTFNDRHFAQVLTAVVAGDGSTVLKLYYDRVLYQIEYDLTGGNWVASAGPETAYGEQSVSIPGATQPGNKLAGWVITWTDIDSGEAKRTEIGAGAAATFQMPYANVLATAVWAAVVDVTVEFVTDDGVQHKFHEELDEGAGTVGDVYTAKIEWVNKYRPLGYRNPSTLPSIVLEGPDGRNIVTVIYKIANDYVINFDANTGKYDGGKTVLTQTGLSMADFVSAFGTPLPTKPGYALGDTPNRWNTKADGTGTMLTASMTYEDLVKAIGGVINEDALKTTGVTVYAMWSERDDLEVKYDLNNIKGVAPGILKPVPDWYETQVIDDLTGVKWTQGNFNLQDEDEFSAAPHGYEFAGWNTKADGTGLTITDATKYLDMSNYINPNEVQPSITLFAMWKEILVKIEYTVTEGGTIDRVVDYVSAVTGKHMGEGSSAGNPLHSVATAKPGYTFKGWELVSENGLSRMVNLTNDWRTIRDGNNEMFVVEPDEDGRLYSAVYRAVFERNPDSVIDYDSNGGTGTITPSAIPHSTVGALSNGSGFDRSHYTLVGWNTKPDGTGTSYKLGQEITFPEGGMKLYAQWNIKHYGVTIKDRDDKIADVIGGTTNAEWGKGLDDEFLSTIAQAPKDGATFKGWSYKMWDEDQNKWVTGVVDDLSELVVLGDAEIEALYDYEEPLAAEPELEVAEEDVVEGGSTLPKTADDTNLFGLLLLALIALFVIFFAARKNDREDETEFEQNRNWFESDGLQAKWAAVAHNIIRKMRNTRENKFSRSAGAELVPSPGPFFMPLTLWTLWGQTPFCPKLDKMGSDPKVSNLVSGIKASRVNFIATITTALVLAAVVAFTPGAAVASTGDPGSSGADTTTQTNTQTHYSNATTDPATSSTGSSASNAARSASSSASAATNADEIEHQKILKKLESANRKATGNSYTVSSPSPSMPAPSSSAATAAPSTSVTVVSNSHSISSASGAAPTTSALAAASFSTSSSASKSSSSAAGSLNRVAATAALTQNAPLTSASAEISDQARESDEGLLLVTGVAPASQTGTATAMLAASDEACTYVCEVPLTSDDAGTTGAPTGNTALYVNDGLDVAAILGRDDDEAILPSTLSEDEFLLSSGGSYQQATGGQFEAEDSDEGEEPADGEDPAGDDGNIDDNADEQPGHNEGSEGSEDTGDTEGSDNSGENSGDDSGNNNSDNEGDNSGDETGENGSDPDDPTDPKDPADGEDPAGDDGKDPASNEGEDPAADDASDDPAPAPAAEEVLYLCTSGGTVSRASEPLNDLQGATAKADRGYCFKAWMASTLHGATPVLLTTDKTLTAESVRDFALSLGEDATDIVFTAIFKPNSYTIKYDLQGAQSSDEASIAPTSATFGEDTTPASSCSLKKDGYTFLCWNTDPDGLGVAVRDDESISDNKLHTMLLIDALDDTSDASTTLYARWVPDGATTSATITPSDEPDVTVPTDPVMAAVQAFRDKSYEQMKDPAIAALFANAASAPSASSSASSSTTVAASATVPRPAAAVAAFSPLAALPLVAATEEATESVEVPTDWIATVANLFALPALPPVLDVLPATAEGLTTISENAAVGLGEVDVTPAQAAEAVGITMAAVAGVAAVAGAAGAAATAMANAKTGNGFSRKRRWKFPTR